MNLRANTTPRQRNSNVPECLFYNLQELYVTLLSILFLILAAEANSTIAPLLYSMWPSLRGSGYQAD